VGVFAGPKTTQDAPIFSIDSRNSKSFPQNGKIIDTITQEERNTTATVEDGYIYSNNGFIDKFSNLSIVDSSAITVNVSVDNTLLKSGTTFSIYSDTSSTYSVSGITSYTTSPITTVALATTSHSLNQSVSGITSYTTSVVNTVALATTSHSLNQSVSGITSYTTSVVNTVALATTSHSLNQSVSGITSYTTSPVTTLAYDIQSASFNPLFELSFNLNPSGVFIKNKTTFNQNYLSYSTDTQGKNIYSVIYRTLSENIKPITLYQNGLLVADTTQITGSSQFENAGISVFSSGNSSYSQYGVRLVNVYNRELNNQELLSINNLKTT
jgi:hypothetical protein